MKVLTFSMERRALVLRRVALLVWLGQHQDELLILLIGAGAGDEQRVGLCPGVLAAVWAGEFRFARAPRLEGRVLRARLPAQREQDMA
jgi:hypothetical protein